MNSLLHRRTTGMPPAVRRTDTPGMMSTAVCGATTFTLSRTCAALVFAITNDVVAGVAIPAGTRR